MNANDVIRIGRSRMRAASTAASAMLSPAPPQLLGELDDQNAVLGRQADQHDQADLAVDVVDQAAQPLRTERAEHGERHRQQDDERQHEALVLSGQRQVDEQQAEAEDQTAWPPDWISSSDSPDHA